MKIIPFLNEVFDYKNKENGEKRNKKKNDCNDTIR